MQSDSGIIYCEPPKPLWVPRHHATRPTGLGVRFKTEICDVDRHGRITKAVTTHEGSNTITDWGMDSLATLRQDQLVAYLHLSDTLGTAKRVLTGGTTLTLTITDASNIAVAASAGFFGAGDVGKTLSIDALGGAGQTQELKITGYTDSQHVTCSTRAGAWLPGFTPGTGPFSSAGVHATDTSTLANQFTKFNTYDTSASNYNAELNDSSNSRSIHQRIFLSAAVTGSAWTINQLGWSDGNAGNNCFGKVNLSSPDVVAVGKKYRVTLQLYSAYTPINISSQSVNWGATIGTYDLALRQQSMIKDSTVSNSIGANLLLPAAAKANMKTVWFTSAFTLAATKWEGDTGYSVSPNGTVAGGETSMVTDAAYSSGQHTLGRTLKWSDAVNISGATGFGVGAVVSVGASFGIKPNAGTITKPSGYWCALTFQLYWTRAFSN